jgi:hypothetical protein
MNLLKRALVTFCRNVDRRVAIDRVLPALYHGRAVNIGQHVRIVEMRGCMADVRYDPRVGEVIGFERRVPYGTTWEYEFAKIQLTDGTIEKRVTEPRLWTEYEGMMEYRD